MILQYAKHPGETIPEPFIWHVYIGLVDGLAYMQTGGEVSSSAFCGLVYFVMFFSSSFDSDGE